MSWDRIAPLCSQTTLPPPWPAVLLTELAGANRPPTPPVIRPVARIAYRVISESILDDARRARGKRVRLEGCVDGIDLELRAIRQPGVLHTLYAADGHYMAVVEIPAAAIGVDAHGSVSDCGNVSIFMLIAGGQSFGTRCHDLLLGAEIDILIGISKDVAVEVREPGIALDDILELAVADFFGKLLTGQAEQIVEAVSVHQRLDLG